MNPLRDQSHEARRNRDRAGRPQTKSRRARGAPAHCAFAAMDADLNWLLKSQELCEEICCFGQRIIRPEVGVRRRATNHDNQEEGNYPSFS
jgi:hypothetical protein